MHARTVIASVLLASTASLVISVLAHAEAPRPSDDASTGAVAVRLAIADLEQHVSALRRELDDVRSVLANVGRSPDQQRMSAPAPAIPDGASLSADQRETAARIFPGLVGTNYFENGEAWRRARRSGSMDELLGMFVDAAGAAPNDISAQMALADAYIANVVMGVRQAEYSRKADEQFDKVLAIDDRHWRARFSKAMSYTFWPDVDGKRVEAIAQFETLMQQQESTPVEQHHAQVYLVLGNLLSSTDMQRARAIWQRGARRHADHEELRRKAQLR